jgi:hypothetical protein
MERITNLNDCQGKIEQSTNNPLNLGSKLEFYERHNMSGEAPKSPFQEILNRIEKLSYPKLYLL